ncbi:MAG TPA: CHAD domain-containing protein [Xanthobacteraceae bacterium]|jgi:CHAD domain-containing protein
MDDRTAFTLHESGAAGEGLRAAARRCLAEARAATSDPARSDAEAVHDFRRAMKRWRALLRLLAPFAGPQAKALRDEGRDLARALAGARDGQSALDAFADLEKHGLALSARSISGLRGRIEALRQAAETTLDADMRLRVASALDSAEAMLERWPLSAITSEALAAELARCYRRARRQIPADWGAASAEELHELRKGVVIHRYQIELAEPLWPRFVKMWTGEAQRLRERLGKHHDLLVLANLTGPHQPLARWRSRLMPAIAARQAAHVVAAERIAARIFLDRPKTIERRLAAMWRMQKEAA